MLHLPEPSSIETTYDFPRDDGPEVTYATDRYRVQSVCVTEYPDGEEPSVTARGILLTAKGVPDRRARECPLYDGSLARLVLAAHAGRA